jgi:CheY-like chemotaxis protein
MRSVAQFDPPRRKNDMDRLWSLLERRRITVKLVAGFAVLLLAILLLGINSIHAARDTTRRAAELHQMELLGLSRIKEANIDLISSGRALRQMVLAPTFVDRDEAKAQLDHAILDLEEAIAAARPSLFRNEEKLLLNEFENAFAHYKRNVNDAVALISSSIDYQQKATAYISGEQFNQVGDSADQLLHRMATLKEEGARETALAIARHSQDTQRMTLGLLLGGLLSAAAVAVLTGRVVKQSADRLDEAIGSLAKGRIADTIATSSYHNESDEEYRRVMKMPQVEFIQAEACRIVDEVPDVMPILDEQGEPLDESHPAPARRASILVVEDNESNREVTVGLLAHAGCDVTIACSAQEALELLQKRPCDVVLMNMQRMTDGIDATRRIRENTAFDILPIIAMTPQGIHQDRERCLAAGMNGHIARPVDPDKLFRALMCWISGDRQYASGLAIA